MTRRILSLLSTVARSELGRRTSLAVKSHTISRKMAIKLLLPKITEK